jgi:uncharacterized protein YcfJ
MISPNLNRKPFQESSSMKTSKLILVIFITSAISSTAFGCQGFQSGRSTYDYPPPPARPNTAAGAVVGGASGSLIGAAIGSGEGKTGKGALIGGLIGATAGGVLGNQADRAEDLRQYEYQQQQFEARQSAITLQQIIEMSQSGLSPSVIVNQINSQGVWTRPTTNDLIILKQNGVSDQVIAALQTGRFANEPARTRLYREPIVERAPVVVEPIFVAPIPHGPHCFGPYPGWHSPGPRYGYRAHGGLHVHF